MTAAPRLASIAVDPGPLPGIAVVRPDGTFDVVQCSAGVLEVVVRALVSAGRAHGPVVLSAERFVVGRRATRSATASAGRETRDQVGAIAALGEDLGVVVRLRSASEVMTWASDERLDAAGLLDATKGMRHARAAARHALYTAHRDCGLPDPLSRRPRSLEDPCSSPSTPTGSA